jgi:hypothetical protein
METATKIETLSFTALPALGEQLDAGTFAGIITKADGTHVAVVLLPDHAEDISWKKAMEWAEKLEAQLPTRPVAALLYANAKKLLIQRWHWTCEEYEFDASYAWGCYFDNGGQNGSHKSYEGAAVAVRLIPITA